MTKQADSLHAPLIHHNVGIDGANDEGMTAFAEAGLLLAKSLTTLYILFPLF